MNADLKTREDLIDFFRDLAGQPGFSFRGLRVEVNGTGMLGQLMSALLIPELVGLLARFSGVKLKKQGIHLKLALPGPLAADLILGSTKETIADGLSFEECFYVDAADMDTVHAFLTDEMQTALLELNRRYFVRMTDDYVEFGPIVGKPEDSADAVLKLVEALPQLKVPDTQAFAELDLRNTPFVIIKTVSSNVSAALLMRTLGSNGIPCRLLHGTQSAVGGNMDTGLGVQVTVPESFCEEALEIVTYKPMTS